MDWYYADESDQQIPFPEEDFGKLVELGAIKPDTLVWNADMTDWADASMVRPALFGQSAPLAPAPASMPPATYQGPPRPYQAAPPTDGMALASLICGILAIMGTCSTGVLFILGLPAVICGHSSKRRSLLDGRPVDGMAVAGMVMGYICLACGAIGLLILVIFFLAVGASTM